MAETASETRLTREQCEAKAKERRALRRHHRAVMLQSCSCLMNFGSQEADVAFAKRVAPLRFACNRIAGAAFGLAARRPGEAPSAPCNPPNAKR